jgi:hypothetical protein
MLYTKASRDYLNNFFSFKNKLFLYYNKSLINLKSL